MQKRTPYRNKRILASANGEACTLEYHSCNGRTDTTVFCHLNASYAGKGKGQKADDCAGFFGCANCHADYDNNRLTDPDFWVLRAYYRTIRRLIDKGVIK